MMSDLLIFSLYSFFCDSINGNLASDFSSINSGVFSYTFFSNELQTRYVVGKKSLPLIFVADLGELYNCL